MSIHDSITLAEIFERLDVENVENIERKKLVRFFLKICTTLTWKIFTKTKVFFR